MAYTFLKAKGYEVGTSLVDDGKIEYCKEMMAKAENLGKAFSSPIDKQSLRISRIQLMQSETKYCPIQ